MIWGNDFSDEIRGICYAGCFDDDSSQSGGYFVTQYMYCTVCDVLMMVDIIFRFNTTRGTNDKYVPNKQSAFKAVCDFWRRC